MYSCPTHRTLGSHPAGGTNTGEGVWEGWVTKCARGVYSKCTTTSVWTANLGLQKYNLQDFKSTLRCCSHMSQTRLEWLKKTGLVKMTNITTQPKWKDSNSNKLFTFLRGNLKGFLDYQVWNIIQLAFPLWTEFASISIKVIIKDKTEQWFFILGRDHI